MNLKKINIYVKVYTVKKIVIFQYIGDGIFQ